MRSQIELTIKFLKSYGKHSYDEDKHITEGKNSNDKGIHSIDE
jgi:hypothetical protein